MTPSLVDTPFQLISGFFHVNQGVLCCEHAEQASRLQGCIGGGGATGLLNKRRGSNRLPGVVTEQQAVEFPQVQTSPYDYESLLIYVVRRQGTPDLFGWSIHGSFTGAIFYSFHY